MEDNAKDKRNHKCPTLRPRSHRTRRCSQMLLAKNGTCCCQLECSHSIASNIKNIACKPAYVSGVNWAQGISSKIIELSLSPRPGQPPLAILEENNGGPLRPLTSV